MKVRRFREDRGAGVNEVNDKEVREDGREGEFDQVNFLFKDKTREEVIRLLRAREL